MCLFKRLSRVTGITRVTKVTETARFWNTIRTRLVMEGGKGEAFSLDH